MTRWAGPPSELVLAFLREEEITPEELDELKRKIVDGEVNPDED